MSYMNAVFYVDWEAGSDAARTALTSCTISNPSGSIIRVNKTAHGLVVGAIVDATLFTAWFNSSWKVNNVVDADNFEVEGTWQAAADASGTITPRGGSSKADAWKTITLGATTARQAYGDEVRVMGSPAPTSLGVTGAWTGGPRLATQTITSSTNATPIVITRASHGYANGDTVIITGHTTNTNANGTWKVANQATNTYELEGSVGNGVGGATGTMRQINNAIITLSSALTANVANPRAGETGGQGTKTNWTASANVTATVITSDFKQGGECQQLAIAAGFTTGLAAYIALAGATDLSAYQQLSFLIKQTAGTLGAAGAVRICLCSDAVGATPVDTFDVPITGSLNVWVPFTVNKGSALGASIQSVNFEVVTDNGAQTFLIDNIIAVKSEASADSLGLTSLVGKNTAGESWSAIQSIVGTRVALEQINNTIPSSSPQFGYTGTTETVTTYKRQPWNITPAAASTTAPIDFAMQSPSSPGVGAGGTSLPVTHSFGWDRTAMTSMNTETWLSGQNCLGGGYGSQGGKWWFKQIGILGMVRFADAAQTVLGQSVEFNIHVNNNSTRGYNNNQTSRSGGAILSARNNGTGISIVGDCPRWTSLQGFYGNAGDGVSFFGSIGFMNNIVSKNNGGYGISMSSGIRGSSEVMMQNPITSGNATAGLFVGGAEMYMKNASIGETTEAGYASGTDGFLVSEDHDGVADNTQIFMEGARIASETTVRHTASGRAWSIAVTASNVTSSVTPIMREFARVACAANGLVTAKLWMRRTNTGLTMRLMCKGGQIAGVANDVYTDMTAAADTWEEVTITFTPTEDGFVSLSVEAFGGTTYIGFFDDFSVTQA